MSSNYTISLTFPQATGSNVGPFLLPPGFTLQPQQPLSISVTTLCAASTTESTSGIATSTAQPDFSLAFESVPPAGGTYIQITVQPTNLYSSNRSLLQSSYVLFRQQVEELEISGSLIPGGARLLLSRVAASLPLRFDEVLFYYYGLDPVKQCIDLQPGMSLRVEWGGYQYCGAPGSPGYALNSYVGQGTSRWVVSQRSDMTLAFNTSLASIAPAYALNPSDVCPLLAAGVIDVQVGGNARRHWRLLYPPVFNGAMSLSNSGISGQNSAILMGADTFADIDAATAAILNGTPGCGTASADNNPVLLIPFAGRTLLVPEMPLMINGYLSSVPVGSSLRNVVQQYADPSPQQFSDATGYITQLSTALWRWVQPTGQPTMQNNNTYGQAGFSLQATLGNGPVGDAWDIPLIKGDYVKWAEVQPVGTN